MSKASKIRKSAETIAPFFMAYRWKWHGKGIPSVKDIEERITQLVDELYNSDNLSISTGRIIVQKHYDEDIMYGISISLELEEIDSNELEVI